MARVSLKKITRKGKALYLAYDQGLEHGPASDFNDKNVDPLFILDIAKCGKYTGIVFQKGIAEKYKKEIKKSGVPLIVKLNGKTNLYKGEAVARQLCTVKEAVKLGASAVGYTIYIGSEFESEMLQEFEGIQRKAHAHGLPVITWIYPRGKAIKNDVSRKMMSHAARTGLEIGADMVKLKYGGKPDDLKWTVKSAGRCKVVVAGGPRVKNDAELLNMARDVMKSGAAGMAIGRNVWQHEHPLEISEKLRKIIFG